jgi:hexokinase
MSSEDLPIEDLLEPLSVNLSRLKSLSLDFAATFKNLGFSSKDQFMSTPVLSLPSGQERGQFLAIDVGGTNLRIAFIELLGTEYSSLKAQDNMHRSQPPLQTIKKTFEKIWPIQEALKMDHPEDLFSWIGNCIVRVVTDFIIFLSRSDDKAKIPGEIPTGITFSFPMMYVFLHGSFCGTSESSQQERILLE